MRYLLGSKFWGIDTKDSDNDYVEYFLPSKKDILYGNINIRQTKYSGDDIVYKDIRTILNEIKKGSVRAFECINSIPVINENYAVWSLIDEFFQNNKDELTMEFKDEITIASIGEMFSRYKKFSSSKSSKEYCHCLKLLYIIDCFSLNQNPFSINNEHRKILDEIKQIRDNTKIIKDNKLIFELDKNVEICKNYMNTLKKSKNEKIKFDEFEQLIINILI